MLDHGRRSTFPSMLRVDTGATEETRVSSLGSTGGLDIIPESPEPGISYRVAKRIVDIVGALAGLILLSPLIFAVILLIAIDSPGPIFHRRRVISRQNYREGAKPQTFDAFKFRTMVPNADQVLQNDPELMREYQKDFKLRNDPRVTRIGHKLRHTSIDEIPQLLNVLRGQMTLVGPRMISPPELAMYKSKAGRLLTVKPGLTGLWQVSGRQTVGYADRVRLDIWYIDHRSPRLDLEIMLRTIGSVLSRRGAF